MYVEDVIPARRWRHVTGRVASPYGSTPWLTSAERPLWSMETKGWTWEMSNGTVGLCRPAATTYAEAAELAREINDRIAKAYRENAARTDAEPKDRERARRMAEHVERCTDKIINRIV